MKNLKIFLGVLGSILLIPTFIIFIGLIIYIVNFIFSLVFFKALADLILWIAVAIVVLIMLFCGYYITVDILERNFKYFKNKDSK